MILWGFWTLSNSIDLPSFGGHAASSTDCRDLQPRADVQAARRVTAPRSGENCMYARLFTKPVSTDVTQHEPIQREAREAKSPPGKMSAGRGFFSVLLGKGCIRHSKWWR